ncbi:hypothetical protein C9924_00350 [Alloalcanivorax venustensis]|nr:hypothetical protein C9924_00350 [Alloalcanivorax venustensis]
MRSPVPTLPLTGYLSAFLPSGSVALFRCITLLRGHYSDFFGISILFRTIYRILPKGSCRLSLVYPTASAGQDR